MTAATVASALLLSLNYCPTRGSDKHIALDMRGCGREAHLARVLRALEEPLLAVPRVERACQTAITQ